jgi:ribosomal-protein-alanine N-acetyltransferase
MIAESAVVLATRGDARAIAEMSRQYIEHGLGWSWTEARVAHAIDDPDTNVAVVRDGGRIVAFGIMGYREERAHLALFAVRTSHQRRGMGSAVLRWLEQVARDAGIRTILVECRRDNGPARNFYGEHGYHERIITPGYYRGVEDAVRLEKWLAAPGET